MKNLALLTDFYELTMIQGYYYHSPDQQVVFDYFVRKNPFQSEYMIFAGLEPLLENLKKINFESDDIDYLQKTGIFKAEFLEYLKNFRFSCDIYSVQEGEIIFPNQPILTVCGSIIEAQLIESLLLNTLNFQTLIATKTARIVESAKGKSILEFGLRRAQGIDGALSATRASYIGGCRATSNTLAGKLFDIPAKGTMAHSWIMAFESELDAFEKYADLYPENTILLVDTYDTIKSGLPNAIVVLKKLKQKGITNFGIRLDSGNLEELSRQARKMLDNADLKETQIYISSELDETIIDELENIETPIDSYGVGTKLVTGHPDASLSGVYKIVEVTESDRKKPVIKVSDNIEKRTNPGFKNVIRFFNNSHQIEADMIYLVENENEILKGIEVGKEFKIVHQNSEEITYTISNYHHTEKLLKLVMEKGRIISPKQTLQDMRKYKEQQMQKLPNSVKQLMIPEKFKTGLSEELYWLKEKMINNAKKV